MPKVDDKQIGVARVYSRALLELAERRGVAGAVQDELGEIVKLAGRDPRFARFVESPLVDPEDRERTLERMFRGRLTDVLLDALQVMNRKGRLAILPTMAQAYHQELEDLRGRVEVQVTSAVALTDELRERLRRVVAASTGRQVDLVERVDDSLIGGLVVRIGDRKIDGTVSYQIRHLREVFHEHARQHIYQSRLGEVEDG